MVITEIDDPNFWTAYINALKKFYNLFKYITYIHHLVKKKILLLFLSCRTPSILHNSEMLFSDCNQDCSCSPDEWDPVCSSNGITYVSPCMAGCISSSGYGRSTVRPPFSSIEHPASVWKLQRQQDPLNQTLQNNREFIPHKFCTICAVLPIVF